MTASPSQLSPTLKLRAAGLSGLALLGVLRADLCRSWIASERLSVETYLSGFPALSEQRQALIELICAEFDLRQQLGPPPTIAEFLKRFPGLGGALKQMLELHAGLLQDGSATIGPNPTIPEPSLTMPPSDVALGGPPPPPPEKHSPPAVNTSRKPSPATAKSLHTGRSLSAHMEPLPDPPPGAPRVPGFAIVGILGKGGMGVVYQAWQVKLNRMVALKMVLGGNHANAQDLVRFLGEAEAAGALHHPNIVQVYEVGQHEGLPYMALEFVAGGSVMARLSTGPFRPQEAAWLVEQLAHGIHAAHDKGIVHRDLKPHNVLLALPEKTDSSSAPLLRCTPKITDFGLAKRVEGGEGLTQTGAIMGTPGYMAPEQAEGKGKNVGPSADVYALGAILYECLTGRPPFQGPTPLETVMRVVKEDPIPVRQLQPKTPRDLETICLKCLQKHPDKRYASAESLAEDLRRWREGEPIEARAAGFIERSLKWVRRRPTLAALGGVTVLAALVLLGVGVWFTQQLALQRDDALDARKDALKEKAEADEERHKADEARRRTDDELRRAEVLLYSGQLNTAHREYEAGNTTAALQRLDSCRWDLRGWEHRYLNTLFSARQAALTGHKGAVYAVAWSPDGTRFASAGHDDTARLWDARTGKSLFTLKSHDRQVTALAFSPDGTILATGSIDNRVQLVLWDVASGEEKRTLTPNCGDIKTLVFTPDGKRLLVGGTGSAIRVLDPFTGLSALTLPPQQERVTAVASSPDGQRYYIATGRTIKSWDARTGRELSALRSHLGSITGLSCSPDGQRLASSSQDRTVKIWSMRTNQLQQTLTGHRAEVTGVTFNHDGSRLASSSADSTIIAWNLATSQPTFTFRGHVQSATSVAFSPDGSRMVSGSEDQTVRVWDANGHSSPAYLAGHQEAVPSVAFRHDGALLASACNDSIIRVWETATGRLGYYLQGHKGAVLDLAFSPDGAILASGGADTLVLWDTATRREIRRLNGHRGAVRSLAFSPDGKLLVSGGADSTLAIWDLVRAEPLRKIPAHQGWVKSVACSPDGLLIASGGDDRLVKLWNPATGELVRDLVGHEDQVTGVAFSPEGDLVVSGSNDRTIRVWETATGKNRVTMRGHTDHVTGVAFSPDRKVSRVVSGGNDQTVRVWDVRSGLQLLSVPGQRDPALGVAFSRDGGILASAGGDKFVRIWDGRFEQPQRTLSGHTAEVAVLALSQDDRTLASGSGDRTIRVWDLQSGQQLHSLSGHSRAVNSLAFSPDRNRLVSAGYDQTVKVWDLNTGRELLTLNNLNRNLVGVNFSADGTRILARDDSGFVLGWDIATGQAVDAGGSPVAEGTKTISTSDNRFRVSVEGAVILVQSIDAGIKQSEREREVLAREDRIDTAARRSLADSAEHGERLYSAALHLEVLLKEQPWDAQLHLRRAHVLARLGRAEEAVTELGHALFLQPDISPWPLDPQAYNRGRSAALAGDYPRAVAAFRLSAQQPQAPPYLWSYVLMTQFAANQRAEGLKTQQLVADLLPRVENLEWARNMLFQSQYVPCERATAEQFVRWAEEDTRRLRNASSLHRLGAMLYRAGRYEEAEKVLAESVEESENRKPFFETMLYQAMTARHLEKAVQAREFLARFDEGFSQTTFPDWVVRLRIDLLLRETRGVVNARNWMPRVSEGD